jgi:hypothetical protein
MPRPTNLKFRSCTGPSSSSLWLKFVTIESFEVESRSKTPSLLACGTMYALHGRPFTTCAITTMQLLTTCSQFHRQWNPKIYYTIDIKTCHERCFYIHKGYFCLRVLNLVKLANCKKITNNSTHETTFGGKIFAYLEKKIWNLVSTWLPASLDLQLEIYYLRWLHSNSLLLKAIQSSTNLVGIKTWDYKFAKIITR